MQVSPGSPIPLSLQLWDGNSTLYVQATLMYASGVPFPTPTVNLQPTGNQGLYIDNSLVMPNTSQPIYATFTVYDDSAYTIPDAGHDVTYETFINDPASAGGGSASVIIPANSDLDFEAIIVEMGDFDAWTPGLLDFEAIEESQDFADFDAETQEADFDITSVNVFDFDIIPKEQVNP